jgi:DNA-binding transcriptional LysR family regulator
VLCDRDISPTLFDKIISVCAQAGFSPRITHTSNVLSSVLTLIQAGEGVSLIPSSLRHGFFNDLCFCPLTGAMDAVELVMAWSQEREGAVQRAFLDFMRQNKGLVEKSLNTA